MEIHGKQGIPCVQKMANFTNTLRLWDRCQRDRGFVGLTTAWEGFLIQLNHAMLSSAWCLQGLSFLLGSIKLILLQVRRGCHTMVCVAVATLEIFFTMTSCRIDFNITSIQRKLLWPKLAQWYTTMGRWSTIVSRRNWEMCNPDVVWWITTKLWWCSVWLAVKLSAMHPTCL